MLSRLARLLLVVSLVLNGTAAPTAMARMSHAEHGTQAAMDDTLAASTSHDHAAMKHRDHGVMDATDAVMAEHESCCDSSACQCGCVLPPAVSPALQLTLVETTERQHHLGPMLHLVRARVIPPLRPPAA